MLAQVQVGAPSNTSIADGVTPTMLAGKAGEGIVTELHGKYYAGNYRGRHFMTQGAAAGITIPVSSATAATFVVYNPIGSSVVVELGKINVSILNATTVVSGIGWGLTSGLTVAPTGITAMATGPANLGGSASQQAVIASAATIVAVTKFFTLFSVSATSGAFPNFNYDHEGSLILQPGSLVHLCGTAAQTSASLVSLTWSEWPI